MKKVKTLYSFTLLMIIALGCGSSIQLDYKGLLEDSTIEFDNEKYILIVPQNGCSTCVKKAYNFILKNYNNESCKFLFTHYSSRKAVKVRFRVLGIEDTSRIGFVELDVAKDYGLSLLYPTLIKLGDSGSSKVTIMNAEDSSDWKKLYIEVSVEFSPS